MVTSWLLRNKAGEYLTRAGVWTRDRYANCVRMFDTHAEAKGYAEWYGLNAKPDLIYV